MREALPRADSDATLAPRPAREEAASLPGRAAAVFKRVLIANRGEIAIRIARAAAGLGIETVSVFARPDTLGLHTRVTTESRAIGTAAADPVAAYLHGE